MTWSICLSRTSGRDPSLRRGERRLPRRCAAAPCREPNRCQFPPPGARGASSPPTTDVASADDQSALTGFTLSPDAPLGRDKPDSTREDERGGDKPRLSPQGQADRLDHERAVRDYHKLLHPGLLVDARHAFGGALNQRPGGAFLLWSFGQVGARPSSVAAETSA
jgi:hypothetical protein